LTDRRAWFFLAAGIAVILVQPLIPQYRWAAVSVAILYLTFAALFAFASISANRAGHHNGHD
jgi:hypothetical protein